MHKCTTNYTHILNPDSFSNCIKTQLKSLACKKKTFLSSKTLAGLVLFFILYILFWAEYLLLVRAECEYKNVLLRRSLRKHKHWSRTFVEFL